LCSPSCLLQLLTPSYRTFRMSSPPAPTLTSPPIWASSLSASSGAGASSSSSPHVGVPADPTTTWPTSAPSGWHMSTAEVTLTETSFGVGTTVTFLTVIPSATLVPNNSPSSQRAFAHNGDAIGGTVGGIVLLVLAVVVWAVFARRRSKRRKLEQSAMEYRRTAEEFRPPLNDSEDDLSGEPVMRERMRGGRQSTLTAGGLGTMTPAAAGGYDPMQARRGSAVEDDELLAEDVPDEEGMYTAGAGHPEVASSQGHYVTAPSTPMPMLGGRSDPFGDAGDGGDTVGVGAALAGTGVASVAASARRRSGPPSPSSPRSRKGSGIEPGLWLTGRASSVEAPPSPVMSSGHGHQSSSSGHPRSSDAAGQGVWRPIGYSSGSSSGHQDGIVVHPTPRSAPTRGRPRSLSPVTAGIASGSSNSHGRSLRAPDTHDSNSSSGHGLSPMPSALLATSAYDHDISRTSSPRGESSHGHSSHGHGQPASSQENIGAPSSQGHGGGSSSSEAHGRRSGQYTRVGFVNREPPSLYKRQVSPVAERSSVSRQASVRSNKSFITKSLRGRFGRKKSDAGASASQSLPSSSMDVAEHFAAAPRRPPVPTFFQSAHSAAHEHLVARMSPPVSPRVSVVSPTAMLPAGAGAARPPSGLGQLPMWNYQPTLEALARDEANNPSDDARWAWPGLSPGLTLPPLPSPEVAESLYTPDGLLDPTLASRLGPGQVANQSTAAISLGDHEDYTRPFGAVSAFQQPIVLLC
jgi:hypothetical protein